MKDQRKALTEEQVIKLLRSKQTLIKSLRALSKAEFPFIKENIESALNEVEAINTLALNKYYIYEMLLQKNSHQEDQKKSLPTKRSGNEK